METANEFITNFLSSLDRRQSRARARGSRTGGALLVPCPALVSDVLPPQARLMTTIRNEICPSSRCSDVDRAIIGASLGG